MEESRQVALVLLPAVQEQVLAAVLLAVEQVLGLDILEKQLFFPFQFVLDPFHQLSGAYYKT